MQPLFWQPKAQNSLYYSDITNAMTILSNTTDQPLSTANNGTGNNNKTGPRFLVIGAGSRGNAYARAVTNATNAVIHAVADIDPFKRREFGRKYIWGNASQPKKGQEFGDWREWLEYELERRRHPPSLDGDHADSGVDGVFVCTLDETHVEVLLAIAPLNLHIMCEKPLATSLRDCLSISKALKDAQTASGSAKIFSIGHVLRYSPHNQLLRRLLLTNRVIGDIVSLEHTEPVGWSHFAHSYVRGNWRRETAAGDGSLLTKSCHDIDFVLWLLCSPPPAAPYGYPHHAPKAISSMGSLNQFKRARKPVGAGDATNCLSCPIERECIHSAVRAYRDNTLYRGYPYEKGPSCRRGTARPRSGRGLRVRRHPG
jgi:predicted dehydrogenase